MKTATALLLSLTLVALLGCGGGSDSTQTCQDGVSTMRFPDGCATASGGGALGVPALKLSLLDATGAATTQVSPDQVGTLQVLIKDRSGAAMPSVAVTFSTSDKTGSFIPRSGTALTDANGVAQVGLPVGTQAGGFTATATATVGGVAVSGSTSYAVGFPALTLSPLSITPAQLSAGGNASVGVTVSSGAAPYIPPLSVAFTSPCVQAGKASIGSPVLTHNGIATASYSDKGCGVPDLITASVTLGETTVQQTGTITVLPASVGSIRFVSADTTNISLRGTGGFGRQEYSTLKFQVSDQTGNKVAGKMVDFLFSDSNAVQTVGGLTLNPASATSAADGTVTTLVTAGTIPTSVRVVATIHGSSPLITTLSDVLIVSTGVADQKHFSLSTEIGNCEGWNFDQDCSIVTAMLGDHFGNPVPDGTAVNFTAEGGLVDASCVTGSMPPPGATPLGQTTNSKVGPGSGSCSVLLRASNPRPANARVTVLAYAMGEEDFVDVNGNNAFDTGDTFTDKSPDIFRDDNESFVWNAGESCIGPNSNNACSTAGDAQYNGVLRIPQTPSAQTLYVSNQLVQIFSGSYASITFNPAAPACPASGVVDIQVTVRDENGNIMPAGSTLVFSTLFSPGVCDLCSVTPSSARVNNIVLAVGEQLVVPPVVPTYTVSAQCVPASGGKFFTTVTTPRGIKSTNSVPIN